MNLCHQIKDQISSLYLRSLPPSLACINFSYAREFSYWPVFSYTREFMWLYILIESPMNNNLAKIGPNELQVKRKYIDYN